MAVDLHELQIDATHAAFNAEMGMMSCWLSLCLKDMFEVQTQSIT